MPTSKHGAHSSNQNDPKSKNSSINGAKLSKKSKPSQNEAPHDPFEFEPESESATTPITESVSNSKPGSKPASKVNSKVNSKQSTKPSKKHPKPSDYNESSKFDDMQTEPYMLDINYPKPDPVNAYSDSTYSDEFGDSARKLLSMY